MDMSGIRSGRPKLLVKICDRPECAHLSSGVRGYGSDQSGFRFVSG